MDCVSPGCNKKALDHFMGFESGGKKIFGYVCGSHDRIIGRRNLMAAGMTLKEALEFENDKDKTI